MPILNCSFYTLPAPSRYKMGHLAQPLAKVAPVSQNECYSGSRAPLKQLTFRRLSVGASLYVSHAVFRHHMLIENARFANIWSRDKRRTVMCDRPLRQAATIKPDFSSENHQAQIVYSDKRLRVVRFCSSVCLPKLGIIKKNNTKDTARLNACHAFKIPVLSRDLNIWKKNHHQYNTRIIE